jgi:hypothetical protein
MNRDRVAKASEALDPSIWHPELLAGPLRSKRLTVLYGAPGPLRDGMLRRGLMPLLRESAPQPRARARRREVPIRFDGWGPLPLQALRTRIDAEFNAMWPQGAPETLAEHLHAIGRQHQATVLLVLDAFERHLGERAERHDIERFDIELSECITQDSVPLHVLIVVDELENRALQRYTRWILDFGDDFLRLPNLLSGEHDAAAWRDTDIEAPRDVLSDDAADESNDSDTDWPVDLLLDVAPPPAAHAPPPQAASPKTAAPTPVPPAPLPPTPVPPTAVPPTAAPHEAMPPAAARAAPAVATPAPFAAATVGPVEPSFGNWPPPATPPAGHPAPGRALPPWLSQAEAEQMRRMHEPSSRWPGLLGLALYMVVLLAGAWWVARWIMDSHRVETRPSAPQDAPAAPAPDRTPAQPPTANTAPPATPGATTATPPQQGTAPAATAAPAAAPAARALTLALPADAGAAAPLVDDLIRRIAAPAGIELRTTAANQPAALALMRTDALQAARAVNGGPLQVLAPLYNEQIQVLVRTDARWDYVREIRGLRLNIGPADGARARTARVLYQQMFGTPLAASQVNELDMTAALQQMMQQRGGPIDAVIVVSDAPLTEQLQPAARRQLRELTIDARHMSVVTSMPGFSISRRTPQERARLATTTYVVAPGAPPRPHEAALRALAAALCRAVPALQAQGSPLLRGWRQGQQPDVGWPYLLPRTPDAVCPAP